MGQRCTLLSVSGWAPAVSDSVFQIEALDGRTKLRLSVERRPCSECTAGTWIKLRVSDLRVEAPGGTVGEGGAEPPGEVSSTRARDGARYPAPPPAFWPQGSPLDGLPPLLAKTVSVWFETHAKGPLVSLHALALLHEIAACWPAVLSEGVGAYFEAMGKALGAASAPRPPSETSDPAQPSEKREVMDGGGAGRVPEAARNWSEGLIR